MANAPENKLRLAWGITGSGHYLQESLDLARQFPDVDLFLSKAAAEVLNMYGHNVEALRKEFRIMRDNTASAAPVGLFYEGIYHTLVIAPATSNTVAKCVVGISDTLVTNIFAQAGKRHIPSIVFACDNEPEVETESPKEWVTVFPRKIDLENTERIKAMEMVTVVDNINDLRKQIEQRYVALRAQNKI